MSNTSESSQIKSQSAATPTKVCSTRSKAKVEASAIIADVVPI
ncbi:hypothetical protein A2U01_0066835, partial [Trifolium medium]|nr:hypothetical protein [Trifolium medium]